MQNKLLTIDVSHGTTHDGPGMRTTVFVKGCPLKCAWCQNPESIARRNEVWWEKANCIGCGSCLTACPSGALTPGEGGLAVNREICRACGACAEACPAAAMTWQGQEYGMDELLREVLRDKLYYRQFGGGVTCSGGEPLLQHEFVAEFFRRLKQEGVTTALDTCGCAPRASLEAVLPHTDYVLYDMKIMDGAQHRQFTGVSNELILQNLLYTAGYIRTAGRPMQLWIRTPLIPGATASVANISAIGAFIRDNLADVVSRWEMCAFNGVCASKYDRLGAKWAFDGMGAMTQSEIAPLKAAALSCMPEEKVLVSGMIREG